jgi:hypothetical protein
MVFAIIEDDDNNDAWIGNDNPEPFALLSVV